MAKKAQKACAQSMLFSFFIHIFSAPSLCFRESSTTASELCDELCFGKTRCSHALICNFSFLYGSPYLLELGTAFPSVLSFYFC